MLSGDIKQRTQLIEGGRERVYKRMLQKAAVLGTIGITGVTSELIFHGTDIELYSFGRSCR